MAKKISHREKFVLRTCHWLVFCCWGVALTPWVSLAQSNSPQIDELRFVPPPAPSLVSSSIPEDGSYAPLTVRGPCDPDYWIVSTRGCKELIECGQSVPYQIFRFDGPIPGRESSLDELLSSIQPGVPVCFMAHGSFVNWDSVIRDSARTYTWLRHAAPTEPIHIIFYTWDSDDTGCLPHLRVNKLGRRAAMNGFYLADLISKVSPDHPICLIGHSHGSLMVSASLHSMAGGEVEGKISSNGVQPLRRIRVVMAAAAVDHKWLAPQDRYGLALCPAEAVINLRNRTDFPLQFYPLRRPFAARALGVSGLTRKDRMELGDWNQKFIDYDVSGSIGWGHYWYHYYNDPAIACAIRHYVYFDENRQLTQSPR